MNLFLHLYLVFIGVYMFAEANYKILGAYALVAVGMKIVATPVVSAIANTRKFF